jgi:hypothetical protein
MEKIITGDGNNKKLSKNIIKGKKLNTNFSHPAYTRYPHLKDPTQPEYSKWEKWFAWRPVETIAGHKVWLKTIYKRQRSIKWTAPTYPPKYFDTIQYAEWETIFKLKIE